jgi:hypothetical protein
MVVRALAVTRGHPVAMLAAVLTLRSIWCVCTCCVCWQIVQHRHDSGHDTVSILVPLATRAFRSAIWM